MRLAHPSLARPRPTLRAEPGGRLPGGLEKRSRSEMDIIEITPVEASEQKSDP